MKCTECGDEFEPHTKRQIFCCSKCRIDFHYRKRVGNPVYHKRANIRYRKSRPDKLCADCGKPMSHNKQTWCIDCLIKGFVRGDKAHKQRLHSRGYDTRSVWHEAQERGLI